MYKANEMKVLRGWSSIIYHAPISLLSFTPPPLHMLPYSFPSFLPSLTSYLGSSCSLQQCCPSSTLPDRPRSSISSAGCSAGHQLSGCRAPDGWTRAGSHWTTSWETETDTLLGQRGDALVIFPSQSPGVEPCFSTDEKRCWHFKHILFTPTEHQYIKQTLQRATEAKEHRVRLTGSSVSSVLTLRCSIIFTALLAQN